VNFSVHYGKLKFPNTGETERFNGVKSNLEYAISRRSVFRVEGLTTKISGSTEKISRTELASIFQWFYNIYEGDITLRMSRERDEISQETHTNHYMLFEIKRTLF
jgi:hypothetical protein